MKSSFSQARLSILGCLLGLAAGDAIGMPTEFLTRPQIHEYYGEVKDFLAPHADHYHAGLPRGRITDDTGQALALLHAALEARGHLSPEQVATALLRWADSMGVEYDYVVGPSTRRALGLIRHGVPPEKAGAKGITNGSAMRAPIAGLLHPGDLYAALQEAYTLSLPSHGTNVAIAGAGAVACAVSQALVLNSSLESVFLAARDGAERGARLGRVVWGIPLAKRIELALKLVEGAAHEEAALEALYDYVGVDMLVGESVATAFGIVKLAGGDPVRAILMSANIGGDTDTIGAIAGSVCGAWKGQEAFPSTWLETLESINHLSLAQLAERLVALWFISDY